MEIVQLVLRGLYEKDSVQSEDLLYHYLGHTRAYKFNYSYVINNV